MDINQALQKFIDFFQERARPENLLSTIIFLIIFAAIANIPIIGMPIALIIVVIFIFKILIQTNDNL